MVAVAAVALRGQLPAEPAALGCLVKQFLGQQPASMHAQMQDLARRRPCAALLMPLPEFSAHLADTSEVLGLPPAQVLFDIIYCYL